MNRYIDADALIQAVFDLPNTENGYSGVYDKACVLNVIEDAPTIEIIRCGECKYWLDGSGLCKHWSKLYGSVLTKADDFCSYGERNE